MFGFATTHAQFNRKSDIFGLAIGSFMDLSRGTKTLSTRVSQSSKRHMGLRNIRWRMRINRFSCNLLPSTFVTLTNGTWLVPLVLLFHSFIIIFPFRLAFFSLTLPLQLCRWPRMHTPVYIPSLYLIEGVYSLHWARWFSLGFLAISF